MLGSRISAPLFATFVAAAALVPAQAQEIKLHRPKSKSNVPTTTVPIPDKSASQQSIAGTTEQKITVEPDETMFAVLAAINACGYDQELAVSDPLRKELRADIGQATAANEDARGALQQICGFYHDHDSGDPARNLAAYVSLALNLSAPPTFTTTVRESDLPPDASRLLGFVPLLQRVYDASHLHQVWMKHQRDYARFIYAMHDPLHAITADASVYLKLPFSGYTDRAFTIILDPLGAPGQVNARNYGNDYYVVVSPNESGNLKLEQIRHTYLHYILDPYALNHGTSMRRLDPLLDYVHNAPLDEAYKNDISLLVIESLIHAIEARTLPAPKPAEGNKLSKEQRAQYDELRDAAVQSSMQEGLVLTRYFFDQLASFEQTPVSFSDVFGDMLYNIDLQQQEKIAQNIHFTKEAPADVLASRQSQIQLKGADLAQELLTKGDLEGAQRAAQSVLDNANDPEAGRALFVLAVVASKQGNMEEARGYFERTLVTAHDPRLVAWSHIYLGRIYDIQENREAALRQYNAAMNSGDNAQDTLTAAQRGLDHPMVAKRPQ